MLRSWLAQRSVQHTTFSLSMEACCFGQFLRDTCGEIVQLTKPEFSVLVWPPFEAMFWTSSLGRLAKLPGFWLSVMMIVVGD